MVFREVLSTAAEYTQDHIISNYTYSYIKAQCDLGSSKLNVTKYEEQLVFHVERKRPKVGVLCVGIGGNNGTTLVAGLLANKHGIQWRTKNGQVSPNWYGSLLMSSTVNMGMDEKMEKCIYAPVNALLPFCSPDDLVIGGWDIHGNGLGDAMRQAKVLDVELQDRLYDEMQKIKLWPGVYNPNFIATNQKDRAFNYMQGSLQDQLNMVRTQIREFKKQHKLEKVILLWTANTERLTNIQPEIHGTASALLKAIELNHPEISPSVIYSTAAIQEKCSIINGAPQNTFVPGLIDLAQSEDVYIVGDDFKTGQTKLKSVLVEFLVSAGIKVKSIASYNHLGNNDGKNLSSPAQFESKNISKTNVVHDIISSNPLLYPDESSWPDHCIVIKYIPSVGDSKRAMDEYVSEIFMNGRSTISIHNTCEDSLLAVPVMLDLILFLEFFQRVTVTRKSTGKTEKFHAALSILSYFVKAPLFPPNVPIVNGLNAQRSCIINVLLACLGLPPESHMGLEFKIPSLINCRDTE